MTCLEQKRCPRCSGSGVAEELTDEVHSGRWGKKLHRVTYEHDCLYCAGTGLRPDVELRCPNCHAQESEHTAVDVAWRKTGQGAEEALFACPVCRHLLVAAPTTPAEGADPDADAS